MYETLPGLCKVCSDGSPRVQNSLAAGWLGFRNKIYLKIFFSRTAKLICLKFDTFVAFSYGSLPSLFKWWPPC